MTDDKSAAYGAAIGAVQRLAGLYRSEFAARVEAQRISEDWRTSCADLHAEVRHLRDVLQRILAEEMSAPPGAHVFEIDDALFAEAEKAVGGGT